MLPENQVLLAAFENIGRAVVGVFAIAGGFLIGNVLTHLGIKLATKLILKKEPPALPSRVARLLGGIALAILVAYFVFGEGGLGWGTGGGTVSTEGKGNLKSEEVAKKSEPTKEPPKQESPRTGTEVSPERFKVVVLGAGAKDNRFYLLDDDPQPHTFAEVTRLIGEQLEKDSRRKGSVAIYVYSNSAGQITRVVTDLQAWAKDQGLEVSFPAVQNQVRPER